MDDDELVELLQDRSRDEEEVHERSDEDEENSTEFRPGKLAEGINIAETLCDFFIDNDPCIERAVMFENELTACMSRYMELEKKEQSSATFSATEKLIQGSKADESSLLENSGKDCDV